MKIRLHISLIILLSFVSCNNRRVFTNMESEFPLIRDFRGTNTVMMADIPWQNFFNDSLLINLIGNGLENNSNLLIAYSRIKTAEANLEMARAAFFPSLNLVGEVQEVLASNRSGGQKILGYSTPQYTLGISTTWEADVWGKLSARKRSQIAVYFNSYEYRNLIQTSLIANIAVSYYTLLALDEQLKITKQSAGLLWETVETMAALMDAGIQNGAAVQQSLAAYYAVEVTIPDLRSQIYQTENSLSVLIGLPPGHIQRSSIKDQNFLYDISCGISSKVLSRRPDVRQAELTLMSALELTNAETAALYPTIILGSGSLVGYDSNTFSHFFRPENIIANIIGQVTQPLFSQKQIRGNIKIAEANEEEALITFSQTLLNATQEVSDIMFSYYNSLEKNPIRKNQIEALETAVYFTRELLVAGEANYTEVLTAQQNLLSALLNDTSDKLEQLQYIVQLYRALGGGY